jgi:peptide chain release factor
MELLLQITSGRGPVECCRAVALAAAEICAEAANSGLSAAMIEEEVGPAPGTLQSALLHIDGDGAQQFVASWEGSVLWVCPSAFRPGHRRKNWFVGVQSLPIRKPEQFLTQDLRYETCKAGGPGGQHVNTTESAVKAIHLPSGLSAIARDERSQTANRKRATARLAILMARHEEHKQAVGQKQRWDAHNELERGCPVRTYQGEEFRRVRR